MKCEHPKRKCPGRAGKECVIRPTFTATCPVIKPRRRKKENHDAV
jgi:hypothetical protein